MIVFDYSISFQKFANLLIGDSTFSFKLGFVLQR